MRRTRTFGLLVLSWSLALYGAARADDGDSSGDDSSPSDSPSDSDSTESAVSPDTTVNAPAAGGVVVRDAPSVAPVDDNSIAHPRPRHPVQQAPAAAAAPPSADIAPGSGAAAEGQYGSRRIQVFLIPIGGSTATLAAGPVQAALESEVAKMPGFHPVDLVTELAAPIPAGLAAKLTEARRAIKDGNKELASQQYSEAANRYQHAADLLDEAGAAADIALIAEAYVRLGVALQYAGEDDPAKLAFRTAARLDLAHAVDGKAIDPDVGGGLDRARRAVAEGAVGTLSVVSNPPGARVFVDGVYRKLAPVSIDHLPVGINHVKLDRPGAYSVVQLVEVKEAQDVPVRIQMKFTDETRELQTTISQLPDAISREQGVPDMVKAIGKRFRLERAVIGVARMVKTNIAEVRLVIFDLPRGVKLVDEKGVFSIEAETGLQNDVAKWARGVIDKADKARDRQARDPLERGDGTEDWYSADHTRAKAAAAAQADNTDGTAAAPKPTPEWERSTYKPTPTQQKNSKTKDPLDNVDGTENW